MGFSSPTIVVRSGDGRNFEIVTPFTYTANDGTVYEVKAGATSDGASTPRGIWVTIPPFGKYWLAAVLHDFLYRFTEVPKDRCDSMLLEAMECLGVPQAEADAIYAGVKFGGWASFEADRSAQLAIK